MDQHGDGELPIDIIISKFLENMQMESVLEDDLRKVITKMDKNGDGYIQYQEFLDEAHKVCIMISDLYLSHAFDLFDLNDDSENAGQIPIEQLQSVMCGAISTKNKIEIEQWEEFIDHFDENKDKLIDYDEFKKMMMSFHEHFASSQTLEDLNLKNQKKAKIFDFENK